MKISKINPNGENYFRTTIPKKVADAAGFVVGDCVHWKLSQDKKSIILSKIQIED